MEPLNFSFLNSCRATLAIVGSFLLLFLLVWITAPIILSNYLTNKIGLRVHVEKVDIFPRKIEIENITIENLPDSVLPTAFSAKEMILEAPIWNFLRRNVVLEKVTLSDVYLGLEFVSATDHKGNWAEILLKMQSAAPTSIPLQDHLVAQTILIRKLEFNRLSAEVVYKTNPDNVRKFPEIEQFEFINVDSQNGIGRGQFLKSILGEMLIAVFKKEGLKNIFSNLFFLPSNSYKVVSPKTNEGETSEEGSTEESAKEEEKKEETKAETK